jgi:clorobiocin biosynthesis protein Clo-hal
MKTTEYDVLVMGGGPAGSTIATLLAMKNHRVLLLEKEKFPRYHIGESLVPGIVPILKELNVLDKIDAHGFVKKYGITLLWGKERGLWDVRFGEAKGDAGSHGSAYEVVRSEFDNLLLRHSESVGVEVREEHQVSTILFEGDRCVGARYRDPDGYIHEARARYVVDATGQSALIGRYLNQIEYDADLKNIALWSYYKNAKRFEGRQAGDIFVENTPEGWTWFIPLHDGTTSVGWVTPLDNLKNSEEKDLTQRYLSAMGTQTRQMLAEAERIEEVKVTRDWSYQCKQFYGPGFLVVGDAAGFIDPLFSTGVFLAMNGASWGAKMLHEALENPNDEQALLSRYEFAYKKFLDVVVSFVHYFYDASRDVSSYFAKAKDLVDPIDQMTARQDFVYLISGLAGLHFLEDEDLKAKESEMELVSINR